MRELIRPTLLLIARLGLFLSLAAWLVSQWWSVLGTIPIGKYAIDPSLRPSGIVIGWSDRPMTTWFWDTRPVTPYEMDLDLIFFKQEGKTEHGKRITLPGIVCDSFFNTPFVSIRHWLIVLVFGVFNGFLVWVYRKRSDTTST